MNPLTPRELNCLQWVSVGKTSWETACILGVAERTVNYHIQNACRKLGVHGRQAAVTAAMRTGMLCFDPAPLPASLPPAARLSRTCPKVSCFAHSRCQVFQRHARLQRRVRHSARTG